MLKYLLKRILQAIPILIGISLISFILINLAPGDPTTMMIDPRISTADLARLRTNLGIDQPIFIRYFYWLKAVLVGNLGYSYQSSRPVLDMILERLPATLILTLSSFLLTFLLAVPLGIFSAIRKGKISDYLITFLSFVGMSLPSFWLALMLLLIFSLRLHWLPTAGMLSFDYLDAPLYRQAGDMFWHLLLPLVTLTIGSVAALSRYQRSSMLEVLSQDFIQAARARGLSEGKIVYRHALSNAMLPLITIFGLSLPGLFGGAFIVETIFAWPGMGRLGVAAIFSRDYPVIMGVVMISALLIIVGNLLADIMYAWADPRIRYGQGK